MRSQYPTSFVWQTLFIVSASSSACGGDPPKSRSLGQDLYEYTRPKAEVACVGRELKDAAERIDPPLRADLCINLLSWGFATDCEAQAVQRYPEYVERITQCLHDRHADLIGCCTHGGPAGGAVGLCDTPKIEACADDMNEHGLFCPSLPDFVGDGILTEAEACAHDHGFDSLGGGTLPPVCGERTVCISKHFGK
jgi:hypothetical protein